MQKYFALSYLLTILTGSAQAQDNVVDHLSVTSLRSELPSESFDYNYPGLGDGRHDMPDCLVLTAGPGLAAIPEAAQAAIAAGLVVEDGPGVLFAGRNVNTLVADDSSGRLRFALADLGTFVTGIRLRTRSGGTLAELVRSALPDYQGYVGFILLRGCQG